MHLYNLTVSTYPPTVIGVWLLFLLYEMIIIKKDNYIQHKHITTEMWCENLKRKYKMAKVSVRVSGTLSPRPAVQHV